MKKMVPTVLIIVLLGLTAVTPTIFSNAQTNTSESGRFKVSGYIVDSQGRGIAGAMIIFNVPNIVPAVYSDYSGYYSMYAPAGNYHVNVWPPFDSNFIYYDQPVLSVGEDISKNITLLRGHKVSGYITDASGTPVQGAVVSLNGFFSGWFSNYMGYYFVSAPPGTYQLTVRPKSSMPSSAFFYTENDVVVNGDMAKNVRLTQTAAQPTNTPTLTPTPMPTPTPTDQTTPQPSPTITPTPTPSNETITPTPSPTETPSSNSTTPEPLPTYEPVVTPTPSNETNTPAPTEVLPTPTPNETPVPTFPSNGSANPTVLSTQISISANVLSPNIGSTIDITGKLTDQNNNPIQDKMVTLSYRIGDGIFDTPIGSCQTNSAGEYSIQWLIEASGSFNLRAVWSGDDNYSASASAMNLTILPYVDRQIFYVESNSIVTGLNFDSNSLALGFTVSGPTGTTGTTKVTLAKTLARDVSSIRVLLDGEELDAAIVSTEDYWVITVTYNHSTHQVAINLLSEEKENTNSTIAGQDLSVWIALGAGVVAIAAIAATIWMRRRQPT